VRIVLAGKRRIQAWWLHSWRLQSRRLKAWLIHVRVALTRERTSRWELVFIRLLIERTGHSIAWHWRSWSLAVVRVVMRIVVNITHFMHLLMRTVVMWSMIVLMMFLLLVFMISRSAEATCTTAQNTANNRQPRHSSRTFLAARPQIAEPVREIVSWLALVALVVRVATNTS
jgi:hypothetical protein